MLVFGSKKESEQPQFLLSFCFLFFLVFFPLFCRFFIIIIFFCCWMFWELGGFRMLIVEQRIYYLKGLLIFHFPCSQSFFRVQKFWLQSAHSFWPEFCPEICAVVVLRWISGSQGERDSETCEQQFWWNLLLEEENAHRVRFKDCAC